jgi:hypothetical protein
LTKSLKRLATEPILAEKIVGLKNKENCNASIKSGRKEICPRIHANLRELRQKLEQSEPNGVFISEN